MKRKTGHAVTERLRISSQYNHYALCSNSVVGKVVYVSAADIRFDDMILALVLNKCARIETSRNWPA